MSPQRLLKPPDETTGAADLLTKVAETLDAPVVTTYAGKGLLAPDHPLLVGFPPHQSEVTKLLSSADTILIVGSDLDQTVGNMSQHVNLPVTVVR